MVLFKVLKFIFGAISFFMFLTFLAGLIIIGSIAYKVVDTVIEDNDNNDGKWTNKLIEFKERFKSEEETCWLDGKLYPCEDIN